MQVGISCVHRAANDWCQGLLPTPAANHCWRLCTQRLLPPDMTDHMLATSAFAECRLACPHAGFSRGGYSAGALASRTGYVTHALIQHSAVIPSQVNTEHCIHVLVRVCERGGRKYLDSAHVHAGQ